MKENNKSEASPLRSKAEAFLQNNSSEMDSPKRDADALKLIHELHVHQIELKMQNEQLMEAIDEASYAFELYNFAPTGYFILSREGVIKETNMKGAAMLGENISVLKNKMFDFFITKKTKPAFNLFLDNIVQNKVYETCEVSLAAFHFSQIDVALTGILAKDLSHCLISVVDITDRNRKENLLRQSERQLNEIQIIANLGTYSLDIIANRWESSEMLDSIFGINSDFDRTFTGWTSIIHPSYQKEMADYFISEVVERKVKFDKEYKIIRQNDKAERWVHGTGSLIFNDENQLRIMVGSIRDITNRKQEEEDIKLKNAELLKLNNEKDKFFSIIAHDLKGPFNGFVGLTKIMSEDLPNLETVQIQKMAEILKHSATNLYKLLENLLQWSQMEQGLIPFYPVHNSLLAFATESLTTEIEAAKNKRIDFQFDIPGNLEVFADAKMLRSIICNLSSNAIKFTKRGGRIILSAKNGDSNNIVITIQDTGIGMNREIRNKLFLLSEQINRKGTENEPSTGLGLFLCNDFIVHHGGTISVESESGKGSTFQFTMPCKV